MELVEEVAIRLIVDKDEDGVGGGVIIENARVLFDSLNVVTL